MSLVGISSKTNDSASSRLPHLDKMERSLQSAEPSYFELLTPTIFAISPHFFTLDDENTEFIFGLARA